MTSSPGPAIPKTATVLHLHEVFPPDAVCNGDDRPMKSRSLSQVEINIYVFKLESYPWLTFQPG